MPGTKTDKAIACNGSGHRDRGPPFARTRCNSGWLFRPPIRRTTSHMLFRTRPPGRHVS
jgi:hypothetical protein